MGLFVSKYKKMFEAEKNAHQELQSNNELLNREYNQLENLHEDLKQKRLADMSLLNSSMKQVTALREAYDQIIERYENLLSLVDKLSSIVKDNERRDKCRSNRPDTQQDIRQDFEEVPLDTMDYNI